MKLKTRWITLPLQAVAVAALASQAIAGCGDPNSLPGPFQMATQQAALAVHAATATAARANNPMSLNVSPVGMWNLQFISQGNTTSTPAIPDGALVDFGYAQWHSDGTEIMNSGGHAANTGNFCLGVWVRTGTFTYEVNHFALSYDPTSGNLVNKINIREQVTLDPSGDQFSGTFTITIFNAAGTQQVDKVTGNIAATRVTVDQTTP
jgi:hypothetical protein